MKSLNVNLIHGENDYLIYKDLKEKKKHFQDGKIEVKEFFGSKNLSIKEIRESIESASLFGDVSAIILRNLTDDKSFYPFVEELVDFLKEAKELPNDFYIYNSGKVLKTSKIYKVINSKGKITEYSNPKEIETLDVIHKSISITPDAARLLYQYTGGNLFLIRNEIKKLQTVLEIKSIDKIGEREIEEYCVKMSSQNEIWDLGKLFLNTVIEKTPESKFRLIQKVEQQLKQEAEPMQILYSFYQYTINAVKMKRLLKKGKGFRDLMFLGYFFVNEFFNKSSKLDVQQLLQVNSALISYEFNLKSGNTDEITGLRRLLLNL